MSFCDTSTTDDRSYCDEVDIRSMSTMDIEDTAHPLNVSTNTESNVDEMVFRRLSPPARPPSFRLSTASSRKSAASAAAAGAEEAGQSGGRCGSVKCIGATAVLLSALFVLIVVAVAAWQGPLCRLRNDTVVPCDASGPAAALGPR